MLRSRKIEDFFEVKVTELKPVPSLTFGIYFYFAANRHIVLWKKPGDELAEAVLAKYQERGLQRVFIHRDDRDDYLKSLNPPAQVEIDAPKVPAAEVNVTTEQRQPRTPEAATIVQVLTSPTLTQAEKQERVSKTAQTLLEKAAEPKSRAEQIRMNKKLRQTIEDVLDLTANLSESAIADVWKLSRVEADVGHGVTVATYAVIFAMAFGRIDTDLLADLAFAGLVHDVGVSQVLPRIAALPWNKLADKDFREYAAHVNQTLELMSLHDQKVPDRVRTIVSQHHEKFNGSGYPNHVEGFKFDDIAQIVAMAEVVSAVSDGQWDGSERTVQESFQFLEKMEKARTFPENFNPDVFSVVVGWTKKSADDNSITAATRLVATEAAKIVKT